MCKSQLNKLQPFSAEKKFRRHHVNADPFEIIFKTDDLDTDVKSYMKSMLCLVSVIQGSS